MYMNIFLFKCICAPYSGINVSSCCAVGNSQAAGKGGREFDSHSGIWCSGQRPPCRRFKTSLIVNPLQNKNLFCICVTEKWLCHIGTEFVGHTISAILWIHVQPFLKFFLLANVIGMCVGIEGKYVFQYYFKLLSWTCKFTLPSSFG
jgi:hypothetical protein